eukprot:3585311-Amphidinium_carterae.1
MILDSEALGAMPDIRVDSHVSFCTSCLLCLNASRALASRRQVVIWPFPFPYTQMNLVLVYVYMVPTICCTEGVA